jgi:hypothetical protein
MTKEMDINANLRTSFWFQFGASMEMLENAIAMCPDKNWDTSSRIWYNVYHCLFWTNYYLSTKPDEFVPPSTFSFSEFDPSGKLPERTYSKDELITYLTHCKDKAHQLISLLTFEKLNERWINEYKDFSLLEILMYNMRHIQHHAAQLNLVLRQTIDDSPKWVGRVKSS